MKSYQFYVSPEGCDDHEGLEDSPFRTIEKARDAIRSLNGQFDGDIIVYVRGGVYPIQDMIEFDARDSGKWGSEVIYRAYPGEIPILSGGVRLTDWTAAGGGMYKCSCPGLSSRQLYVNGQRAIRARTPNRGQYYRLREWDKQSKVIKIDREAVGEWSQLEEVEMVVQQYWAEAYMRLRTCVIEGDEAKISFQSPESDIVFVRNSPARAARQSFHFENALEFLDEEGEWYLDAAAGELYYIPRSGEEMANANVIAPSVETLISIRGTLDEPVQYLRFQGFVFEHTTWLHPAQAGYMGLQAGQYNTSADADNHHYVKRPPAGVAISCANQVRMERNIFRHMGATAVDLQYGTHHCAIEGNLIIDTSGNGISIGKFSDDGVEIHEVYRPDDFREASRGDQIRNNHISFIGQDYYGCVGIAAGYVHGVNIEHNELEEMPYSGISIGWGWHYADSALGNNLIRWNKIRRAMKLLCDGGGIYTLSKQAGTVIAENFIHEITRSEWALDYPIAATYFDQGTEGIYLIGNESRYSTPEDVHLHLTGPNYIDNGKHVPDRIIANAGLEPEYRKVIDLLKSASV